MCRPSWRWTCAPWRYGREGRGTPTKAEEQVEAGSDDRDLLVCRCEEITLGEILAAIDEGITTPNGLKRRLRIGMGLCQGRTCRLLLTRVLAERLGVKPEDVTPATFRPPVRPVRWRRWPTNATARPDRASAVG